VQGLLVDTVTGKLEWIVNGYEALERSPALASNMAMPEIGGAIGSLADRIGSELGDLKFPDAKIGELATGAKQWLSESKPNPVPAPAPAPSSPPIPVPPPIHMHQGLRVKKG
jgi:hypothetical protein